MNFKRIIALICTLAILCTSAGAYTSVFPEEVTDETAAEATDEATDEVTDEAADNTSDASQEPVSDNENQSGKSEDESAEDEKVEDENVEDEKSEDKNVEDEKSEDESAEDKNVEDKKSEDESAEDKNVEDEKSEDESAEDKNVEDGKSEDESANDNGSKGNIRYPQGIYSKNSNYILFRKIMDLYVDQHLYEFTHEEVMYKFFEDFLEENPMLFKYVINCLLGTMDPFSAYHEADDGFLDGDTVSKGFGLIVKEDENGRTVVNKVAENSNAEKAGVLPGDKVASIMGFKVDDLPFDAVTTLISSIDHFITDEQKVSEGEDIVYNFEFERNGEIVPVSIAKGEMVVSPFDSYVDVHNDKEIGVISLAAFSGKGVKEKFDETLSDFTSKGIKHLTIDLRDNTGGSLDYALSMVECFIPEGELICYYNDRSLKEPHPIYSTKKNHYSFDSIAILVNDYTASASELFSHILRVKGLAKLIGSKTYGKGIGQSVVELTNGDYITITTYEMLDINLENYHGTGLIPDLQIENTEMCYTLPTLMWFNHENYKEIKEGVYSDPAKALEDRLNIAGFLSEEYCDGIFDDTTRRALYIFQLYCKLEPTGVLNDETVTKITTLINKYKTHTYFEDSPYEVSLYMHRSFSQGKRRVTEIEKTAREEQDKIKARDNALEQALDSNDENEDKDEQQSSSSEQQTTSQTPDSQDSTEQSA